MAIEAHDFVNSSPTNIFATLNPLAPDTGDDFSMSEGNLRLYTVSSFASDGRNISTISFLPAMGKIYIEVAKTTNAFAFGFSQGNNAFGIYGTNSGNFELIAGTNNNGQLTWQYRSNSGHFPALNTSATEVIGVLIDFTNSQFKIKLASTDYTYSFTHSGYINFSNTDNILLTCNNGGNAGYGNFNFGADSTFAGYITLSGSYGTYTDANGIGSFFYDPTAIDSDAKALCTANIQSDLAIDPAVDDLPEDYFKCVKYNGVSTGGGNFTVPVGFQSDLIWIKRRNNGNSHSLSDSVRGFDKWIIPDADVAERNNTSNNSGVSRISTVNSSGFTVHDNHNAEVNDGIAGSASQYISWNWKAGGGPTADYASSNDTTANGCFYKDGSAVTTSNAFSGSYTITPTRASIGTKQGFSIVKYTGNQTSGATFPHGLNKAPEFVIIKNLNDSVSSKWAVFHKDSIASGVIYLDDAAASASGDTNVFNSLNASTISTNNIITLGDYNGSNGSSDNHIMYAFTSIEGYSAFGSYTGNGSTDGPFIYTGFKPALVLIKCISDATTTHTSWAMYDNAREPHNVMNKPLYANQSAAEGERGNGTTDATDIYIDFLSNGFKVRSTKEEVNDDGETYIFCAWAEMPQKFSVAR